jgi:hypothetical protein
LACEADGQKVAAVDQCVEHRLLTLYLTKRFNSSSMHCYSAEEWQWNPWLVRMEKQTFDVSQRLSVDQ